MAQGYIHKQPVIGNRSGEVPVSNGTVCTNLNAQYIDGYAISTTNGSNNIPLIRATGTWTPTVSAGCSGITYSAREGSYTSIGNLCILRMYLVISFTGVNSSTFQISGFPYTRDTNGANHLTIMLNGSKINSWTSSDRIFMDLGGWIQYNNTSGIYTITGDQLLTVGTQFTIRMSGVYAIQ